MSTYTDQFKAELKEVNKLIDINKDACQFYNEAKDKVSTPNLTSKFADLCQLHKGIVSTLQSELITRGATQEDVEASETVVGKANKVFGEIMAKMSSEPEAKLISRLEEAEDRCLHSMEDAIKSNDVTTELKTVLKQQLEELRKSHDHMKSLKVAATA